MLSLFKHIIPFFYIEFVDVQVFQEKAYILTCCLSGFLRLLKTQPEHFMGHILENNKYNNSILSRKIYFFRFFINLEFCISQYIGSLIRLLSFNILIDSISCSFYSPVVKLTILIALPFHGDVIRASRHFFMSYFLVIVF